MAISFEKFDLDFYLYMNDNLNHDVIKFDKKLAYKDYSNNINDRIVSYDENILENFDSTIYILCNKDLKKLNIKSSQYAKFHYIKFGYKDKRICNIEQIKKILIGFNWIEYIYINPYLIHILKNDRDCIIHYLLNGIKTNKKYLSDKIICKNFDWNIYINYYHDLNNIKNEQKAFEHYIKDGINQDRVDWIQLQTIIYNIDELRYKELYPEMKNKNKHELIYDWMKNNLSNKILTLNNIDTTNDFYINNEFCIAISVYSDKNTPKERLYASYKCLNYIFLLIKNCNIFIVIDNNIIEEHLNFLKQLKKIYNNCFLYINNNNYGIAATKNICINILSKQPNIKYFCLLDDDIFIKNNFVNYAIRILNENDIPILTNFNKALPYYENTCSKDYFIKSDFFLGNILVFNINYFKKFGYFREFPYKWGEEHQEFTKRYLSNSKYKNITVDFRKYINDEFFIDKISTLHLHSVSVDHNKVELNKDKYFEYISNFEYVDFIKTKYIYHEII